jgi:hypothetical protein
VPLPSQADLIVGTIKSQLSNPLLSVPVRHFVARHAEPENFERGYPDYLGPNPGQQETGVIYEEASNSPLRGVFCKAKISLTQALAGNRYQAENRLYLAEHPGDVVKLDDAFPKLQDKFIIMNGTHYAVGPATPCHSGEIIAMWQVDLISQRIPVEEDAYPFVH